jgi:hypothetical protein
MLCDSSRGNTCKADLRRLGKDSSQRWNLQM